MTSRKILEKLILQKIRKIESKTGIEITHKGQHGYKKGKSTNTAGLLIQSLITKAFDEDQYALMASVDLSSAFDVVDIKLLIKRMRIIGLPEDIIKLIENGIDESVFKYVLKYVFT